MIPRTVRRMMIDAQPQQRPQDLDFPPRVNAPLCSSDLHILSPAFSGMTPSAAICAATLPLVGLEGKVEVVELK